MSHESASTHKVSKKFSMIGAALSLLVPVAFGGCGDSGSTTPTVPAVEMVAGAMLPRTGPNANSDWVSAVELAVFDINAGIKKAKMAKPVNFHIDEQDTASNEAMALAAMGTYQAEGAKIVITEASAAAIGSNKWNYDQAHIDAATQLPVVSFTATSATLNKVDATDADPVRQAALQDMSNWFFRTCQISDLLAPVRLAQIFSGGTNKNGDVNGDGTVKVVWIGTQDTSTTASITGDQKAVNTYLTAHPLTGLTFVAETVQFDPGADPTTFDYAAAITAATDSLDAMGNTSVPPDLIINKALPTVAIPFIKAYKQNTANTTAIFQDGSFRRNTLLAALGSTADGQIGVSNIAYTHNASGELFKTEQQAQTLWAPAAYESQGYDAMAISLLAVIKASITATQASATGSPADVTPAMVRDALGDLNHDASDPAVVQFGTGTTEFAKGIQAMMDGKAVDYLGASGDVNFDALGNVKNLGVLWKIQGGQFVETTTFDCVTSPACTAQ
jgi:hypothetical protein